MQRDLINPNKELSCALPQIGTSEHNRVVLVNAMSLFHQSKTFVGLFRLSRQEILLPLLYCTELDQEIRAFHRFLLLSSPYRMWLRLVRPRIRSTLFAPKPYVD